MTRYEVPMSESCRGEFVFNIIPTGYLNIEERNRMSSTKGFYKVAIILVYTLLVFRVKFPSPPIRKQMEHNSKFETKNICLRTSLTTIHTQYH